MQDLNSWQDEVKNIPIYNGAKEKKSRHYLETLFQFYFRSAESISTL